MFSAKRCVLGAATLAAVLWAFPAQAVPILSVSPATSTSPVGGQIAVDILITDVADLFGFQLDLTFNPAVLEFLGASRGDLLPVDVDANGDPIDLFLVLGNGGAVSLFDSRACDVLGDPGCTGISGGGRLATLTFAATQAGRSSLALDNVLLSDPFLNVIESSTEGGAAQVGEVPEPGLSLLLGTGLVAAGWVVRGRRRSD